jgi:hypothetical protein
MSAEVEDLRLAVYDAFRRTGAAPAVDDLARAVGSDVDQVRWALAALHRTRDLVRGDDPDRIVMAHPFTSVPLGNLGDGRTSPVVGRVRLGLEACVAAWLDRQGRQRGYVMDLATLWRLARGWYSGRLERGYRRREPAEAAEYFTSVGLRGPFWGLPE